MEEERLMILQMVADGKITAVEAAELLEALEESAAPALGAQAVAGDASGSRSTVRQTQGIADDDPVARRVRTVAERIAERAGLVAGEAAEAAASMAERIASRVEEAGERIGAGGLGSLFESLGEIFEGGWRRFDGGDVFTHEKVIEGSFETNGPVHLDLATANGRIEVVSTERDDYRLVVSYRISAKDADEARQRADQATRIEQHPDRLLVDATMRQGVNWRAAIVLELPRRFSYRASLSSSNGRIVVERVRAEALEARTSNGRIVLSNCEAGRVGVRTANGSVRLETLGGEINARTANGSITFVPDPKREGRANLATSNGSIRILTETDSGTGYELSAQTSFGSLQFETPDGRMEVLHNDRALGRRRLHARSFGFADAARKYVIEAQTSMGSIRLKPLSEADRADSE